MSLSEWCIVEHRAKREALEEQALADGQLWTVQIAYKHVQGRSEAFALVHFGRISEEDHEALVSQHTDAHMFLEPTVILGDKLHVRQQVCKMANTDEITIRVIGAPKRAMTPVAPGIWGA